MALPVPQTEGVKTIFLFRVIDGKRIRFRFTLSEDHTIIDETVLPTEELSTSITGVETVRSANGGIKVTSISPEAQRVLSFFSAAPCWFAGCEDLRQQYKAELAEAEKANCRGCAKGPIMRKYQALVSKAIAGSL